jgi:hypothetical protein
MEKLLLLEGLFRDFGTRLSSENDLSDFTWAMGKNFGEFLHAFMDFFGFDYDAEAPWEVFREYILKDGSRPDLVVKNGSSLFVIESKVYDKYYHFEQYRKASPPDGENLKGLSIIVNHKIDANSMRTAQQNNFVVKTWGQFIRFLEDALAQCRFDAESEKSIRAYTHYVKEVCSIMELKEIRFDNLSSLFYFHRLIRKILEGFGREGVEVGLYKASRANGENWSGEYFSLKRRDEKTAIYPFLGIYYGEEPPTIYFAFEKDWCKDIYSKYKGKEKEADYYYIETTDWEVSFCLNEDKFDDFNKASLEQQEVILRNFLNEVFDEIAENI